MAGAVECSVQDLSRKVENVAIDVQSKISNELEVVVNNDAYFRLEQPMNPSPASESFPSSGSVASSSEAFGESANSYCSSNDCSELAYVAAPNLYFPSLGHMHAGSPAPLMNVHGYVSYPVEGVHFQNPLVDYNYISQPVYGPLTEGVHYNAQSNGGYVFGPQGYQYSPQPYYQQAPLGQYVGPTSGLMVLDMQDPGMLMPNACPNSGAYVGPMHCYPYYSAQPPNIVDGEAAPVAVSFPTHTLRASAPEWVEPMKFKGAQKQNSPIATNLVPQLSSPVNFPPLNKSLAESVATTTGSASKIVSPISLMKSADRSSKHLDSDVNESRPVVQLSSSGSLAKDHAAGNNTSAPPFSGTGQTKDGWVSRVRGQHPSITKTAKAQAPSGGLSKEPGLSLTGEKHSSDDFPTDYDDAKFFIIKSYSDENVFRSIQHNVWASTPNGNKKLDEAFQDAQRRAAGKPTGCPVFLFFSVNGSRQFCGVAEMSSPVDHNRTMEFWEQHKWNGSFKLKWHIVKDVPNSQFRRIILENNENKPVTNSRDTQEVGFQHGLEMLKIVKSYPARGSILDVFPAYQASQKVVQDVKPHWSPQCFPKIGEHGAKSPVKEPGLKVTTKLNFTAAKVVDSAAISKEANTFTKLAGKGGEAVMDKDKVKSDKENLKFHAKESLAVPA